jgi:hypothetical protein
VAVPDGGVTGAVLYSVERNSIDSFLPPRYHSVARASAVADALCFLFLGAGRIHVFYQGQKILSHRNSAWHLQLRDFKRGLAVLAKERGVGIGALETVMRIALLLADGGKGTLITVGDHDGVLALSDPPKTSNIQLEPLRLGVVPDEMATGLMAQDGASIVSADGILLQAMTFLRPPAGTEAEEEVGRGSKHSTAAKISRVTKCIAVAVSVDGRVTVYVGGSVRLKVMG